MLFALTSRLALGWIVLLFLLASIPALYLIVRIFALTSISALCWIVLPFALASMPALQFLIIFNLFFKFCASFAYCLFCLSKPVRRTSPSCILLD